MEQLKPGQVLDPNKSDSDSTMVWEDVFFSLRCWMESRRKESESPWW